MNREIDSTTHVRRPRVPELDGTLGHSFPVLDHGFVRMVDYMGDEAAVVQAARVSYGKGTKSASDDRGLLRYLLKHHHTTPFEMVEVKLHVKLPIFVARQWIRHRTANVNEYSARYSILEREFHIPEAAVLAKQSVVNKQGRDEGVDDLSAEEIRAILLHDANRAFDSYEELADEDGYGLARELARINLPLSTYTEWYWKTDMHNLMHFMKLRSDPHAQHEIKVYSDVIGHMVKTGWPNIWEAFVDYKRDAVTFSRMEMEAIRTMLADCMEPGRTVVLPEGVSERENREFMEKIS